MDLEQLKKQKEAPEWMQEAGFKTLSKGYLLNKETPRKMYERVSKASAQRLGMPELEKSFFDIMWNGWLGLASPVASNMGTDRGLPISCYSLSVPDSVYGIYSSVTEMAMLTKGGGGVGVYAGNIRGRGTPIKNNGKSEGIVPWLKVFDSAILATSQGSVRRGAAAIYLDAEHIDFEEFLRIRRPEGDINRHCMNLHHAACITDDFMKDMLAGNKEKREAWQKILEARLETGEPYIMFTDNVNNTNPEAYKKNNLSVKTSNICSEILLHTDDDHTFVCCLSSLNLAKYKEWSDWKDSEGRTVPYLSTLFLDGVLQEFIERAKGVSGFERSVRSAEKGRALGLGVMGWHTYLQKENMPMGSFAAKVQNKGIFSFIMKEAQKASKLLAKKLGEPEWCVGTGMRNTHLIALAPTVSNATITGGVSPSIEPWAANAFNQKTAKGTFLIKNKELEILLKEKGKNTKDVWTSIANNNGSVLHLDFLTDEEKEVFLTAREIDQRDLVQLAADRYPYIDQGQSLNLFFDLPMSDEDKKDFVKYFHEVHVKAWKLGIKTLYYVRSNSVIRANSTPLFRKFKEKDSQECDACEG